jgi:hypothetical protein
VKPLAPPAPAALEHQKRVVPVLLDSTALSAELAAIHGIDLRGAVVHLPDLSKMRGELDEPYVARRQAPAKLAPTFNPWWFGAATAIAAGIAFATFAVVQHRVSWRVVAAIGLQFIVAYVFARLAFRDRIRRMPGREFPKIGSALKRI